MRIQCGPFLIFSDFDSGNVLTAELLNKSLPDTFSHQTADYELNIFTKPDCYGTIYQNGNRTWFHFGIQGGRPGAIVKLNILNLNKQVKLFSQGMQPVFRFLPEKSDWERVRDRLIINEKEEHVCSISFRQRLPEDTTNSALYLAFTYPLSYVEMTEWLNCLDTVYLQTKSEGMPFHVNCKQSPKPSRGDILLLQSAKSEKNQIYYHRECVCYSLEGRRIELITITSCFGMSEFREERLVNLFPIEAEARPHKFPEKKVIFISARVHPGETSSSFVLNGFYKFLLEPLDPRALMLRRLFVFKFIPMLNPDGVALGHYRTDTRGINLNRVYLKPSLNLHPSIYASRKLLLYYHHGRDTVDDYDFESQCDNPTCSPPLQKCYATRSNSNVGQLDLTNRSEFSVPSKSFSDTMVTSLHVNSEFPFASTCAQKDTSCMDKSENNAQNNPSLNECKMNEDEDANMFEIGATSGKYANMSFPCEDNPESTFEACDEDSLVYVTDATKHPTSTSSCDNHVFGQDPSPVQLPSQIPKSRRKSKSTTKKRISKSCLRSSNHLNSDLATIGSESGLFCYIDMHGHATKRGIFMYGNHFSDPLQQSECMLLPKLMSMNCAHFDFSACNFTERLMSMRDRRDGASREGSGRVAVLKLTGLIRSYTLECNYNTGRLVNQVSRGPILGLQVQDGIKYFVNPPKFTPELFEDAGRNLAISCLDLTGRNSWSRIGLTDFRTIDGMRKWLLKRVQASASSVEFGSKDLLSTAKKATTGPLVAKKENQNSVKPLKPCSSKTLKKSSTSFDKPTCSSNAKAKNLLGSPIQSKISLLQVFKVKKKSKKKPKEKNLRKI